MGSLTVEVPGSVTEIKSKRNGADGLEREAIGLDVSVRIHGSQVAAVVLDATEHVEPFEEDTSTMIVFPRGAVVKLQARVRNGHTVVLTHLATKQTALCRIVQVNSPGNATNYVKLEFIQPTPGFWGVHFPSEPNASATTSVSTQEETAPRNGSSDKFEAPTATVKNISQPTIGLPPMQASPQVTTPLSVAKPPMNEAPMMKATDKAPTLNYGIPADARRDEVTPLAATPVKTAPKIESAAHTLRRTTVNVAAEAPVFDSLSTGEEIFGQETRVGVANDTSNVILEQKTGQGTAGSFDPAIMLQGEKTAKRHTGVKVFLSVAAMAILAAGAVFYVRQYRSNARESASAVAPVVIPQTAPPTDSAKNSAEIGAGPATTPAAPSTSSSAIETQPIAKYTSAQTSPPDDNITVTPVRSKAKNPVSESHPTISNGTASIYAGDLAARPEIRQAKHVAVNALLPTINSTPKDLAATSPNAGLGSLLGGSNASLPVPPEPSVAAPVVRGGQITPPRLLRQVNPVYPTFAASNHIEGDVEIEAVIDTTGKVTSTKAVSGPTLLRAAAMSAVRQWKYSPAALDGKPITMQYKVTVRFRFNQ